MVVGMEFFNQSKIKVMKNIKYINEIENLFISFMEKGSRLHIIGGEFYDNHRMVYGCGRNGTTVSVSLGGEISELKKSDYEHMFKFNNLPSSAKGVAFKILRGDFARLGRLPNAVQVAITESTVDSVFICIPVSGADSVRSELITKALKQFRKEVYVFGNKASRFIWKKGGVDSPYLFASPIYVFGKVQFMTDPYVRKAIMLNGKEEDEYQESCGMRNYKEQLALFHEKLKQDSV